MVHERHLLPVPDGVPWPEAGGFPEVYTTAFDALFTQCGLALGERCSSTAPPAAWAWPACSWPWPPAPVWSPPCATPERRAEVAALTGATAVDPEGFEAHGPFDVVLELVGAPNLAADLAVPRHRGTHRVIGVGAGAKAEVNLLELMGKRARIHGSTLRARSLEEKATVARGRWSATCCRCSPPGRSACPCTPPSRWPRPRDAYEQFAAGGKLGKIVLVT